MENFPTLAIYRGDKLLHFGVSLPQQGVVARLIDELATRDEEMADAPQAVRDLPRLFAHCIDNEFADDVWFCRRNIKVAAMQRGGFDDETRAAFVRCTR